MNGIWSRPIAETPITIVDTETTVSIPAVIE
jgi:hypothetical protein